MRDALSLLDQVASFGGDDITSEVVRDVLGLGLLEFLSGLPQVRGFLEPEITPALLVEVSAAALTMGIVGSIYPAWRAVRLNPVDALRRE